MAIWFWQTMRHTKSRTSRDFHRVTIWHNATLRISLSLLERVRMSKLTTFVLKRATQAKAESGGEWENTWPKSSITNTGSYIWPSCRPSLSLAASTKDLLDGNARHVRRTRIESKLCNASRGVDDVASKDEVHRPITDATEVLRCVSKSWNIESSWWSVVERVPP